MRWLLRGFTIVMWVLGIVAMFSSILPGWEDESERAVSLSELWSDGSGLMILAFGAGMILLGTIIYKGWPWVRHALMTGIAAIGISGFVRTEYEQVPAVILIVVALIAIVLGVRYFYFRSEVVDYFTQRQPKAEQADAGNRHSAGV